MGHTKHTSCGPRSMPLLSAANFVVCTGILLLPAVFNYYPLVYGDTGVYLTDGVELHQGWARPIFYGLFMRATHLRLSAWPIIICQAALTVFVVRVTVMSFIT